MNERLVLLCIWFLALATVLCLGFMSLKLDAMHDDIDQMSELVADEGSDQ
jgi:hypothetical protein